MTTERPDPPLSTVAGPETQRCQALKSNGQPCTANAGSMGFCIGHRAESSEWRTRGGYGSRRANRAEKLLPSRLRPVITMLERALGEVHKGEITPQQATAMARITAVLISAYSAGEFEERLRAVEEIRLIRRSEVA